MPLIMGHSGNAFREMFVRVGLPSSLGLLGEFVRELVTELLLHSYVTLGVS